MWPSKLELSELAKLKRTKRSVKGRSSRTRSTWRKNSASSTGASAVALAKTAKRSDPELKLADALRKARVSTWIEEHKFHETRKWRFDFAWPDQKLAVEVEGGAFSGGRHTRGIGFVKDCEKYNAAVLAGWRVLRFVPRKGDEWIEEAVDLIAFVLKVRGNTL